jgi:hypothetical protein
LPYNPPPVSLVTPQFGPDGKEKLMMRLGLTFVALLVACAIAGAQGAAGGGQGAKGSTSMSAVEYMSKFASETQMVRGCLKPPATGTAYSLTDAVEVKAGAESGPKKTFTLLGMIPPNVKLKDHVNHKVEIAGTMMEGGKFAMADFKMVSTTCP